MGDIFDSIPEKLARFIEAQHVFFVATAPLGSAGHVNVSPKGLDTLRLLGPNAVAYLDLTGSGNETSAHIAENGRITFMFCAFEGPAMILRLYGRGRTILPGTVEWDALIDRFPGMPGARQLIAADIDRVQTSCGYAVPFLSFERERPSLTKWALGKGEERLAEYRREYNVASIDDLPTPLADEGDRPVTAGERR
jgi:hypothetical protein